MRLEGRVLACVLGGSVSGVWLLVSCGPATLQTARGAPVVSAAGAPNPIEAAPAPTETAPTETAPVALEAAPLPPQQSEPIPPANAVETVTPAPDDPLHGKFSLADATAGVRGRGALVATIDTELGKLECELFDDKGPLTVANFIGLARGTRPWKDDSGNWVQKPAYDGTTFHRIHKGFVIQGGDPTGSGIGEPGYHVQDEYWDNALYDRAGLLCLANMGRANSAACSSTSPTARPRTSTTAPTAPSSANAAPWKWCTRSLPSKWTAIGPASRPRSRPSRSAGAS